jgi:hypothetical protein
MERAGDLEHALIPVGAARAAETCAAIAQARRDRPLATVARFDGRLVDGTATVAGREAMR